MTRETKLVEECNRLGRLVGDLRRESVELQRRIDAVLDCIDGMEDVEDNADGTVADRPNLAMRVGMILRGEDRP